MIPRESYVKVIYDNLNNQKILKKLVPLSLQEDPNPPHFGKKNMISHDLKDLYPKSIELEKSKISRGVRNYLHSLGFMESYFQKLLPGTAAQGGAQVFNIKEHHKTLSQSPQLEKQRIVNKGIGRVYSLGNSFRAENHKTTRHHQEFLMIDLQMSTRNLNTVINVVKGVVKAAAKSVGVKVQDKDFRKISYGKVCELIGKPYLDRAGELEVFNHFSEDYLFITDYPEEERPFYSDPNNNFDLLHRRMELASGGLRVMDPTKLVSTLESRGLSSENFEEYLQSFRHGVSGSGGAGIGFNRLVMVLLNLPSIDQTTFYWV